MLRRMLQIRRGEASRAALLFAYLFLVISSYVVTKSTRDALFLQRYSADRLPYADIASALTVAVVMAVYLRVHRRIGLRPMLVRTLLAFSAVSVGFWIIGRGEEPSWMLPALYVWASVLGVLLPAQVWTLANYVMTTREAKRLFGIVGSGGLCGWMVGGLITRTSAARLGTENLLLMIAATLAICAVLVAAVWRERKGLPPSGPLPEASGLRESFSLVWQSPHLRAIASLVCLSSLVTTIVAWQFRAIAKAFIPDTDALAAFFGTFNVYAGALSLATQLLLTSRLLRSLGLGVALLVVPLALTSGSLGILISGSLLSAVLLKGGDQILRYSIDRSTVELLYLPVPARLMAPAKALIDTVIWRAGDAVGALFVLAGVSLLGLSATRLSVASLLLLAAWIVAAVAAERHYVRNLRNSIYEHRLDVERLAQVAERSATDALTDALGSGDPSDILYALTLLEGRETEIPLQPVRRLLDHRLPDVRRKAVALLADADDTSVLDRVERLFHDDADQGVRTAALLYLSRLSDVDPLVRLTELDHVHASSVASAIAQFLARPGPKQNIEAARLLLDVALNHDGPDGYHARLEAARVVGSFPDCFNDQLNRLLKDLAPEVVRLAIRAAAQASDPASVPLVIAWLCDPTLSDDATDALATLGERAVPALRQALLDPQTPAALRHAIPDILQRVATPEAEQGLVENLLDPDPMLRLRTVSALNKLRQLHPARRLERELIETVLAAEILGHYRSYQLLGKLSIETVVNQSSIDQVKLSMSRELERIFRLMKLLLPDHDLHSAYVGLQSENAAVHDNAVEFLENALPTQFRSLVLPLIDSEISLAQRMRLAERMVGSTHETSEDAVQVFAASGALLQDVAANAERNAEWLRRK
jgi:ATP:ADP antiporter, AAA family